MTATFFTRRALLVATVATAACMALGTAQAQQWPTKPVRPIVPYAPGGTTDYVARQVAHQLAEQLGKSFVVDNSAGPTVTNLAWQALPQGGYRVVMTKSSTGTIAVAELPAS